MKKIIVIIIILIALFLIVNASSKKETVQTLPLGNTPNSAENAPPGSIHNLPIPEGVRAARLALATRLSIQESTIVILEAIETRWPDACLGIPEKDKMCAQVITPGYNILMQANGKEYRFRTNTEGTIVKGDNLKTR